MLESEKHFAGSDEAHLAPSASPKLAFLVATRPMRGVMLISKKACFPVHCGVSQEKDAPDKRSVVD